MRLSVKVDLSGTNKFLNDFMPKAINAATARALDRVATTARKSAVKTIKEQTGLPPRFIRERLAIKGARANDLTATITARKGSYNLARFAPRKTATGLSVNAWNKRKTYPGVFLGNAGRTAFKRVGKERLPIKAVFGPSVPRTFMQQAALDAMQEVVARDFQRQFDSALKGILARKGYRL